MNNRWLNILIVVFVMAIMPGCVVSKGFDRGSLRQSVQPPATDKEIQAVFDLKPQLPVPFKLGVYLAPGGNNWRRTYWSNEEVNALLAYGDQLKDAGIVSDVRLVSDFTVEVRKSGNFYGYSGSSLKDLRLAAARHGVDALLIVNSASTVDRYNNPAALLYWTIVGLYVVPGTHSDALVMMSGSLWDVRNEFLYATEEAEGMVQTAGPSQLLEDVSAIDRAKRKAIEEFGRKLVARLTHLQAVKPDGWNQSLRNE
jgi:rhombotail lipoprotein